MLERLTLDQYEFDILRISNEWFEKNQKPALIHWNP